MKQACRECWDPVDRDGADLCDWCASTPEQRRASMIRSLVVAMLAIAAFVAIMVWSPT